MNSIEEYFLTGLPPALEELKTLFPTLTVECIEPDWLKLSTTKMGKGVDLFFPNGKEIIIKLSKPTMGWWKTKVITSEKNFETIKGKLINYLYCSIKLLPEIFQWNDTYDLGKIRIIRSHTE